jgi:hypothetical protein
VVTRGNRKLDVVAAERLPANKFPLFMGDHQCLGPPPPLLALLHVNER